MRDDLVAEPGEQLVGRPQRRFVLVGGEDPQALGFRRRRA